ncbi:MAG: hypothetical protein WAS51_12230 [Ilumatobacteraceae bacterium]
MDQQLRDEHLAGFDGLIEDIRSRLLPALVAKWGVEVGSDVCSEVEEYAWSNQDRLVRMENPIGYLYRVAAVKSSSALTRTRAPLGTRSSAGRRW